MVRVTPSEKELFEKFTIILSQLNVDRKSMKLINNITIGFFTYESIHSINFYINIFQDSRVMSRLVSNKAKTSLSLLVKRYEYFLIIKFQKIV